MAYHLRSCVDLSLFFGECLRFLKAHISEPSVDAFAFRVVSAILHCHRFNSACLEATLPIVLFCAEVPNLRKPSRALLVDAFVPFLPRLETDAEAQSLMLHICELTDSPGLWLVAAAFQAKRIPFVGLTRTYEEIIAAPVSPVDATVALRLFSELVPSVTRPLLEALLAIAVELLTKFDSLIEWKTAVPLFRAARAAVAFLKPALSVLTWLFKSAPDVSLLENDDDEIPIDQGYAECAEKIAALVPAALEVVSMTTCKQLAHLRGMIDQQSPPTIYPYATQFEMYRGLKHSVWEKWGRKRTMSVSQVRGPGKISPSRSLVWLIGQGGKGLAGLALSELTRRPVIMETLNLGEADRVKPYVVSPADFAQLGDK
jgi:hypothetical protein